MSRLGSSHLFLLSAGGGGVLAVCPPDYYAALSSAPVSIVTCPIDFVGNLVTVFCVFNCICIVLLYLFVFVFFVFSVPHAFCTDLLLLLLSRIPAWFSALACLLYGSASLLAVFWTPDSCRLAWMIDTVCLGPVFLILH